MGKFNVIAKLHTFNVLQIFFYENFITSIKTQKIYIFKQQFNIHFTFHVLISTNWMLEILPFKSKLKENV